MRWVVMIMYKSINKGSAAPLALLFTLVSMFFTTAYLKNSFSQTAMEKFRYTEWKALYAAEAGLNDVGIVVLPYICLLYTSPSPRDRTRSRMPSSA